MEQLKFYIDGAWVDPAAPSTLGVINPATEESFASISVGSRQDVDRAVRAARRAFATYSEVGVQGRLTYLRKIIEGAIGVLVPHVKTAADAREIAAMFRYRNGSRGFATSTRAGNYSSVPM